MKVLAMPLPPENPAVWESWDVESWHAQDYCTEYEDVVPPGKIAIVRTR